MRPALLFVCSLTLCSCTAEPVVPQTPAGSTPSPASASALTPMPPDSDGDGVPDDRDACPQQPEDCDEVEDEDGCPDPDDDKDGILDICDACPNMPGPSPNGCPLITLQSDTIRIVQRIPFERGSDAPARASLPIIDEIATALFEHPEIELVEVLGHCSLDEGRSHALSERRARAVRRRLLARGVAAERVVARGAGPEMPIDDNKQPEGRKRNRRVEFQLLKIKEPPTPARPVPIGPPECPSMKVVPVPVLPPGGCQGARR
jgi:outer membrane protein OmpA-like peptidoglycan-associated protein